jgi:hypothetical protein
LKNRIEYCSTPSHASKQNLLASEAWATRSQTIWFRLYFIRCSTRSTSTLGTAFAALAFTKNAWPLTHRSCSTVVVHAHQPVAGSMGCRARAYFRCVIGQVTFPLWTQPLACLAHPRRLSCGYGSCLAGDAVDASDVCVCSGITMRDRPHHRRPSSSTNSLLTERRSN